MPTLWRVMGTLLVLALGAGVWALTTPVPWGPADENDQAPTSLALRWSPVTGATRYRVPLSSAHTHNEFTTTTTRFPLADLPVGVAFTWCVRAENAHGSGAWAPDHHFTTQRPTLPGKLVLSIAGPNSSLLYTLNADGSDLRRLSAPFASAHPFTSPGGQQLTTAMDYAPVFSPDGSKIAFCSTRDGSAALYLMNADGSGVTCLTHDAQRECSQPCFTPDGRRLVFRNDGALKQLAAINLDGSGLLCLGNETLGAVQHFAVSPDSHHVAFVAIRDTTGMLYLGDLDNGKVTALGESADPAGYLGFSADGMRIAYTCLLHETATAIAVKAMDAGAPALLQAAPLKLLHTPAFTRDDTRIFFLCAEKNRALYSAPVDGGPLIRYAADVCLPVAFNPDGRYVAYAIARAEHSADLFISDITGQHRYRLTDQHWSLTSFDWGATEQTPAAPAPQPDFQDTCYMASLP